MQMQMHKSHVPVLLSQKPFRAVLPQKNFFILSLTPGRAISFFFLIGKGNFQQVPSGTAAKKKFLFEKQAQKALCPPRH
ncbi:hypothetical protein [Faecalispora jeddahensis]|uniref:hypothetical protein n=1 Tax=Faecalispora jeddahensis TaxID=1414721 RepID=UPI00145B5AE0|nr:hypothetical protein [Faecalispora jeddahensis]